MQYDPVSILSSDFLLLSEFFKLADQFKNNPKYLERSQSKLSNFSSSADPVNSALFKSNFLIGSQFQIPPEKYLKSTITDVNLPSKRIFSDVSTLEYLVANNLAIKENIVISDSLRTNKILLPQEQSSLNNLANNLSVPTISKITSPFSKLYVFGDSLSDQGNVFNVTSFANRLNQQIPLIPDLPYFKGRFSNGPLWIDYLSAGLGLPLQTSSKLSVLSPALAIASPLTLLDGELRVSPFFNGATTTQGVNFAFGGAQTGFNSGLPNTISSLIPGVLQQVDWFVSDHKNVGKSADANALYVVLAGGNDYLNPSDALKPIQSVTNIALSVAALYSQGARNFLIPNLPNLGAIPRAIRGGIDSQKRLSGLTIENNNLLAQAINTLAKELPNSNFIPLDFYGLFSNLTTSPSQFGLTNITEPCLDESAMTLCSEPNTSLFWDEIHPTAIGHLALGISALLPVLAIEAGIGNMTSSEKSFLSMGNQYEMFPSSSLPFLNQASSLI